MPCARRTLLAFGTLVTLVGTTACATPQRAAASADTQLAVDEAARIAIATAANGGFRACCAESAERTDVGWHVALRCAQSPLSVAVSDAGDIDAFTLTNDGHLARGR